STSGGLQLQLPTNATGQVPISNVTNKTPIVSKSTQLQLSSISSNIGTTQQVIASMKTGINPAATQMIKPMLPSQFAAANSHQIVISPYGMLPQPQQTILPANKAVLDAQKGKSFMLHNPIQPKSPILPTTAMTSQFKTQLNANQLITQASPAMIANQTQILGSFSAIPQAFLTPQSLMGQNSSPIFIRGPGQQDIGFIQTSSPQIQTVSGNPIYMNPNGGTMQVVQTNQTSCPGTSMAHSFISTSTPTTTSHVNSNVTTTSHSVSMGNVVQHPTIAPAPSNQTAIRPKPLRPSVGTQTAASPSQQKLAAETNLAMLKPIAAKTKTPVAPKCNVTTVTAKPAASVVSTQTLTSQQQAQESVVQKTSADISVPKVNTAKAKPVPAQKSSAAQTTISRSAPISAGSQTTPQQSSVQSAQVPPSTPQPVSTPSQTVPSPQLHQSSSTTTQHPEETSHSQLTQTKPPQKEKHIPPPPALPPKPKVEKRDAATEQDVELMGLSNEMKAPPQSKKAIVKPQVMTHVIDGYIIQESPNPFPVNGKYSDVICETTNKQEESIASLNQMIVTNGVESKAKMPQDVSKCENCGKTVPKSKNHTRKRKRFCSQNCVKSQNKQPKLGLFNPVKSSLTEFDISNIDNPLSTSEAELQSESFEVHDERKRMKMSKKSHGLLSTADTSATKSDACSSKTDSPETNGENISSVSTEIISNGSEDMSNRNSIAGVYIPTGGQNPIKWSVQDVFDFVRNLPGCQEYADEFRSQEIDGQALMLLKEDHLMSAMNMKLGPALKICSKINALREKADAAKLM
ncbi:polyhomeotic-like protein 2, partial [Leptotrombidium deliense]